MTAFGATLNMLNHAGCHPRRSADLTQIYHGLEAGLTPEQIAVRMFGVKPEQIAAMKEREAA